MSRVLSFIISILSLFFGMPFSIQAGETATIKIVAITQIVAHPSLDKVRQGMIDELAEKGYQDGKTVRILFENAQGSPVVAAQIAQHFVALHPAVIVAIATPSAQAAANAAKRTTIPVVFATVTDPIQAKLVSNLAHPGGNITGTRNVPAIGKQMAQIKRLLPNVKTIGIVLNYGETNSVQLLEAVKQEAARSSMQVKTAAAPTSAEVKSAVQSLMGQVDVLLLLQDNTVASALPAVLKVAEKNKAPVFATFIDAVKAGALAGVAYDEYGIGKLTGKMVAAILQGKKPGDIPVADPIDLETAINLTTAKQLNLAIDPALIKTMQRVYPDNGKQP